MNMHTPQTQAASAGAGGSDQPAGLSGGGTGGGGTGSFSRSAAADAAPHKARRVTDAPTRMAHWLMALSFAGAYITAESETWRPLHITLGYTLLGALLARLAYGLMGPRQAALGLLARKLAGLPAWLRGLQRQPLPMAPHWRQGQHLMMALVIAGLMGLILPLTLSGYATYNEWGEAIGSTLGLGSGGEWLAEVHAFFGDAMLAMVLAHAGLIAGLSLLRRKNVARPMLTGHTDGPGPDLVRHNRRWLAALMLLAALAFGAWQWQQFPNGLLPARFGGGAGLTTEGGAGTAVGGHDTDRDDEDDD